MLLREGCDAAFTRLDTGYSRINMKIRAERETEINGRGPAIPRRRWTACLNGCAFWRTGTPWSWGQHTGGAAARYV